MPRTDVMEMYLLNFANERFRDRQQLGNQLAAHYGVKHLFSFSDEEFRKRYPEFYLRHRDILDQPRGCGYWLWKPFLILETLIQMPKGDTLMYCDSGALLVNSPEPLFTLAGRHEQIFFNMPQHKNREWAKRDIFVKLGCDSERYWDAPQVKAQCSLWKHCQSSVDKLSEWLELCTNPQLITDTPSVAPNLPEFVENRHDQSILSVLVCRWGDEIFRDPSQEGLAYAGLFPNSGYGMILSAVGGKST